MHVTVACLPGGAVTVEVGAAATVGGLRAAVAAALGEVLPGVPGGLLGLTMDGHAVDEGASLVAVGAAGARIECVVPTEVGGWCALRRTGVDVGAADAVDYRALAQHARSAFDEDPPRWDTLRHLFLAAPLCTAHGLRVLPKLLSSCTTRCLPNAAVTDALLGVAGFPIDRTYRDGKTALMIACAEGYTDTVNVLLRRKAGATARSKKTKWHALMFAAAGGHVSVVEAVCSAAPDMVNAMAGVQDTESALTVASDRGDQAVVDVLVRHGACGDYRELGKQFKAAAEAPDVPAWDELLSILRRAPLCTAHGLRVLPKLLSSCTTRCLPNAAVTDALLGVAGFPIDRTYRDGKTALMIACAEGYTDTVDVLLRRGANASLLTREKWTALMWASFEGRVDVVGKVCAAGAGDVNTVGGCCASDSALTLAADRGHVAVLETLLRHGAHTEVTCEDGWCVWSGLLSAAAGGHESATSLLLRHGADARKAHHKTGWAPLHHAAYRNHVALARLLIDGGAADARQDDTGVLDVPSPLALAARRGHEDMVELLLGIGWMTARNRRDGHTPLLSAVYYWRPQCALRILEGTPDADIDARDTLGRTALHWAAARPQRDVAAALVSRGADACAVDSSGRCVKDITAAYRAAEGRRP
eukprot:TRINITY_DN8204_c0_g13_i1.p1 TRINITY_DN8204_c0_g13~~TRINITY_DN8204_c0_g13_i1.p1  ORF type:complete len:661 (+),score=140.33 TRINITY_DN8204_c0_g13_i1:50-1984(+)